jgi:branched-chain amino acid transport system permease protein
MRGSNVRQLLQERVWPLASLILAVLVIAGVTQLWDDIVITRVVVAMLINLIFVVGLYAFSGQSGILSFGHMSFAALGAYMCAFLTIPEGLKQSLFRDMPGFMRWTLEVEFGLWPAVLVSGLVALGFAVLVSPAFARLAGLQAGIATLALLIVVYTVLLNWTDLTRGSSTMIGVPADVGLGTAVVGVIAALCVVWAYCASRRGLILRATREDVQAAEAAGLRIGRERAIAWGLSAFVTGCGGALYAHFVTSFTPGFFYLSTTFVILAMLVVGGMRSLAGAVAGTVVFSIIAEVIRRVQGSAPLGVDLPAGTAEVVLALLVLAMLILRPAGLTQGREVPWPRVPKRLLAPRKREAAATEA